MTDEKVRNVECPTCHAKTAEPCKWEADESTAHHQDRIEVWKKKMSEGI